jgi:uncharacterized membrane protein YkgB
MCFAATEQVAAGPAGPTWLVQAPEIQEELVMSIATLKRPDGKKDVIRQARGIGSRWTDWMDSVGRHSLRYGLVLVLFWIGAMKFTAYEAEGISEFVSHSPLMFWAYRVLGVRQFSGLLGVIELLIAMLIAARPFSPKLSAVGSALAAGMFLTTLSFLFSSPGVFESSLGFPALSVVPGQFLIKDLVLLGAAVWTTGEAFRAARTAAPMRSAAH